MSIAAFVQMAARTVGYDGRIIYDASKLEGTSRKLVDLSRLATLVRRAGRHCALLCRWPVDISRRKASTEPKRKPPSDRRRRDRCGAHGGRS